MGVAVGIDLGTTYSVIAHVGSDGQPRVIANEFGNNTTPSVVYLGPGGPIVGEEAKNRQAAGAQEVAAFFKREMGDPTFELEFGGRAYTPVDLSALVLRSLKEQAERALGQPVSEAVITVPAYFTHPQRMATREAGERAGLRVLEIINEPSAAARAYGLWPGAKQQRFLVYDLGGGTFDVTVVELTADEIRVRGIDGDHRLGGRDWDDRLMLYLAHLFERECGVELLGDDVNALLVQAETLKRTLSAREAAPITVRAGGVTRTFTITRRDFELQTRDLVARTEMLCEQTLRAVGLTWGDLDGVLPVGGSTRMPMIRACIERMSGKPPMRGIHPDEAVGIGAAITAALAIEREQRREMFLLPGRPHVQDVIAHSLGLIAEAEDGRSYLNSRVIRKNSEIPCAATRTYTMSGKRGAQTQLEVFLTQGELDDPQECTYLGLYEFTGFPARDDADFTIDVTYRYTREGTVEVSALERGSRRPLSLAVKPLPPDVPARFLTPPNARRQQEPMTLYLAFDLSGSMRGEPLAEAKRAAMAFMSNCDPSCTSVGLLSFSDRVSVDQRATHNYDDFKRAVERLAIGQTGYGNVAHPFKHLAELLGGAAGRRCAVVLADGVWVHQRSAIKAAKECHAAGIEIIAVGFGKANRTFLRAIASSDEQSFFTDLGRLSETFSTIARELNANSPATLSGRVRDAWM
jgi:molecular chaperone DnaK